MCHLINFSRKINYTQNKLDNIFNENVISTIFNNLFENEKLFNDTYNKCLNEQKVYKIINSKRPKVITRDIINLPLGRFYDTYKIENLVLKIERHNQFITFPGLDIHSDLTSIKEEDLNDSQNQIYHALKDKKEIENSIKRSISNQRFYYDILLKKINSNLYPITDFGLFAFNKRVYETQIQEYINGPTLINSLKSSPIWTLLLSRWKLKKESKFFRKWIIHDIDIFCEIKDIDHKPDNFIIDLKNNRVVLIDIQQMIPEKEKFNQLQFQRLREFINWDINPYNMEYKPKYR